MALSSLSFAQLPGEGRNELLQVAVEGIGYIGFVEISGKTTLSQLRTLISQNLDVDAVPPHFQFVRKDGILIGTRVEGKTLARQFLPSINIVATPESPLADKVKVHLWTGAVFSMWALPSCTFAQLRVEASRFWHLNPADTSLQDAEGVIWPDTGLVQPVLTEAARAAEQLLQQRIAGGMAAAAGGPASSAPPSIRFILRMRNPHLERALDPRSFPSMASPEKERGGGSGAFGRLHGSPGGSGAGDGPSPAGRSGAGAGGGAKRASSRRSMGAKGRRKGASTRDDAGDASGLLPLFDSELLPGEEGDLGLDGGLLEEGGLEEEEGMGEGSSHSLLGGGASGAGGAGDDDLDDSDVDEVGTWYDTEASPQQHGYPGGPGSGGRHGHGRSGRNLRANSGTSAGYEGGADEDGFSHGPGGGGPSSPAGYYDVYGNFHSSSAHAGGRRGEGEGEGEGDHDEERDGLGPRRSLNPLDGAADREDALTAAAVALVAQRFDMQDPLRMPVRVLDIHGKLSFLPAAEARHLVAAGTAVYARPNASIAAADAATAAAAATAAGYDPSFLQQSSSIHALLVQQQRQQLEEEHSAALSLAAAAAGFNGSSSSGPVPPLPAVYIEGLPFPLPCIPRSPSLPLVAAAAASLASFAALEHRLWRVFTYYAAAGDSMDPFHLRTRQWRCFLDDCGLLASSNTAVPPSSAPSHTAGFAAGNTGGPTFSSAVAAATANRKQSFQMSVAAAAPMHRRSSSGMGPSDSAAEHGQSYGEAGFGRARAGTALPYGSSSGISIGDAAELAGDYPDFPEAAGGGGGGGGAAGDAGSTGGYGRRGSSGVGRANSVVGASSIVSGQARRGAGAAAGTAAGAGAAGAATVAAITPEVADLLYAAVIAEGRRRANVSGPGVGARQAGRHTGMAQIAAVKSKEASSRRILDKGSSTGMDYLDFIRALIAVALRLFAGPSHASPAALAAVAAAATGGGASRGTSGLPSDLSHFPLPKWAAPATLPVSLSSSASTNSAAMALGGAAVNVSAAATLPIALPPLPHTLHSSVPKASTSVDSGAGGSSSAASSAAAAASPLAAGNDMLTASCHAAAVRAVHIFLSEPAPEELAASLCPPVLTATAAGSHQRGGSPGRAGTGSAAGFGSPGQSSVFSHSAASSAGGGGMLGQQQSTSSISSTMLGAVAQAAAEPAPRLVNGRAAAAFMRMLRGCVAPRARCWSMEHWKREAAAVRGELLDAASARMAFGPAIGQDGYIIEGSSIGTINGNGVAHGVLPGGGGGGAGAAANLTVRSDMGTLPRAGVDTLLQLMTEAAPMLRMLFAFYVYAPSSSAKAGGSNNTRRGKAGGAGQRGAAGQQMLLLSQTAPAAAITSAMHAGDSAESAPGAASSSSSSAAVAAAGPGTVSVDDYMEQLRALEASRRQQAYEGGEEGAEGHEGVFPPPPPPPRSGRPSITKLSSTGRSAGEGLGETARSQQQQQLTAAAEDLARSALVAHPALAAAAAAAVDAHPKPAEQQRKAPLSASALRFALQSAGISPNSAVDTMMLADGTLNKDTVHALMRTGSIKGTAAGPGGAAGAGIAAGGARLGSSAHSLPASAAAASASAANPPKPGNLGLYNRALLRSGYAQRLAVQKEQRLLQSAAGAGGAALAAASLMSGQLSMDLQLAASNPPSFEELAMVSMEGGGSTEDQHQLLQLQGSTYAGESIMLDAGGHSGSPSAGPSTAAAAALASVNVPSMRFETFQRFITDFGLSNFGKAASIPARLISEAFIASACSTGLHIKPQTGEVAASAAAAAANMAIVQGSTAHWGSTSSPTAVFGAGAGAGGDVFGNRLRLTFPQLLECVGRIALRAGALGTIVSASTSNLGLSSGSVSGGAGGAGGVDLSTPSCDPLSGAAPFSLRFKCLLQLISNRLNNGRFLEEFTLRRDHSSAYPEHLLRGALAAHALYATLQKRDSQGSGSPSVDYLALFAAYARQPAVGPAVQVAPKAEHLQGAGTFGLLTNGSAGAVGGSLTHWEGPSSSSSLPMGSLGHISAPSFFVPGAAGSGVLGPYSAAGWSSVSASKGGEGPGGAAGSGAGAGALFGLDSSDSAEAAAAAEGTYDSSYAARAQAMVEGGAQAKAIIPLLQRQATSAALSAGMQEELAVAAAAEAGDSLPSGHTGTGSNGSGTNGNASSGGGSGALGVYGYRRAQTGDRRSWGAYKRPVAPPVLHADVQRARAAAEKSREHESLLTRLTKATSPPGANLNSSRRSLPHFPNTIEGPSAPNATTVGTTAAAAAATAAANAAGAAGNAATTAPALSAITAPNNSASAGHSNGLTSPVATTLSNIEHAVNQKEGTTLAPNMPPAATPIREQVAAVAAATAAAVAASDLAALDALWRDQLKLRQLQSKLLAKRQAQARELAAARAAQQLLQSKPGRQQQEGEQPLEDDQQPTRSSHNGSRSSSRGRPGSSGRGGRGQSSSAAGGGNTGAGGRQRLARSASPRTGAAFLRSAKPHGQEGEQGGRGTGRGSFSATAAALQLRNSEEEEEERAARHALWAQMLQARQITAAAVQAAVEKQRALKRAAGAHIPHTKSAIFTVAGLQDEEQEAEEGEETDAQGRRLRGNAEDEQGYSFYSAGEEGGASTGRRGSARRGAGGQGNMHSTEDVTLKLLNSPVSEFVTQQLQKSKSARKMAQAAAAAAEGSPGQHNFHSGAAVAASIEAEATGIDSQPGSLQQGFDGEQPSPLGMSGGYSGGSGSYSVGTPGQQHPSGGSGYSGTGSGSSPGHVAGAPAHPTLMHSQSVPATGHHSHISSAGGVTRVTLSSNGRQAPSRFSSMIDLTSPQAQQQGGGDRAQAGLQSSSRAPSFSVTMPAGGLNAAGNGGAPGSLSRSGSIFGSLDGSMGGAAGTGPSSASRRPHSVNISGLRLSMLDAALETAGTAGAGSGGSSAPGTGQSAGANTAPSGGRPRSDSGVLPAPGTNAAPAAGSKPGGPSSPILGPMSSSGKTGSSRSALTRAQSSSALLGRSGGSAANSPLAAPPALVGSAFSPGVVSQMSPSAAGPSTLLSPSGAENGFQVPSGRGAASAEEQAKLAAARGGNGGSPLQAGEAAGSGKAGEQQGGSDSSSSPAGAPHQLISSRAMAGFNPTLDAVAEVGSGRTSAGPGSPKNEAAGASSDGLHPSSHLHLAGSSAGEAHGAGSSSSSRERSASILPSTGGIAMPASKPSAVQEAATTAAAGHDSQHQHQQQQAHGLEEGGHTLPLPAPGSHGAADGGHGPDGGTATGAGGKRSGSVVSTGSSSVAAAAAAAAAASGSSGGVAVAHSGTVIPAGVTTVVLPPLPPGTIAGAAAGTGSGKAGAAAAAGETISAGSRTTSTSDVHAAGTADAGKKAGSAEGSSAATAVAAAGAGSDKPGSSTGAASAAAPAPAPAAAAGSNTDAGSAASAAGTGAGTGTGESGAAASQQAASAGQEGASSSTDQQDSTSSSSSSAPAAAEEETAAERKAREEAERAAAEEAEKQAALELLKKGGDFVKFGRKGSPHPRTVMLTADGSSLHWAPPAGCRAFSCGVKAVPVSDILEVRSGASTAVFTANAKKVKNRDLCLSVVTEQRTLDLECKDEQERDQWVAALSKVAPKKGF